ncbi:MAG TPA: UDP-N-acetylmuramoyl-L-alanyl-D-glutamate--2,6-diaminopimelate ligase [Acidobacteriaceae bacterium]|nr:UDP-N-acetylmuramoyl-L-alanyl-D-glutamate--2,6-diaminopimelate ligase [Acidobacteriaceae bacterium]
MRWDDVVAAMRVVERRGRGDADVRDVQYDSRRVGPGDVFVAMRGGSTDGNRFVRSAIERGVAAAVTDSAEGFAGLGDVPAVLVEHGRRALAEASAAVFGHPEKKLKISAVTGTNGKTTTAFLLEQMLASVGRKCVLVGTIETRIADEVRASEHTTPESRDLLALFAEGVRAGCTEVVMEMSSHALEQERVWGIPVDVAIFTNLTQDHLDFHGTMGAYARSKAKLFAGVGASPPRVAVINDDADYAGLMIDSYTGDEFVVRYGIGESNGASFRAVDVRLLLGSTQFRWVTPDGEAIIRSPLTGRVNVENLLAAMCAALARGLTLEQIASAAESLHQVPGRFQIAPGSQEVGFMVVVDYAHTDDALSNLIRLARESVVEHGGRVITMFGCGGDRDRTKRPKMGRAAGAESDLVIVTSDNPRSEDPIEIINEALLGVRETNATFVVEEDRRAAIEVAIRAARPGDIVLLAGKGHEKEQIFADGAVHFDDVEEASRILREIANEVKQ